MDNKKPLNAREVAQIKKIFQVNEQDYARVAKLEATVAEAQEEIARLKKGIDLSEERVKSLTGCYTSTDLIKVVITPLFNEDGTPKMDKEGKYQQKKKQYVLKYPETIFPIEANGAEPATEETQELADAEPAVEEPAL